MPVAGEGERTRTVVRAPRNPAAGIPSEPGAAIDPAGHARQEPAMKKPVRVAVTGAAGQIGYSLLFRIASGALLGPDQPVILQLLEITPALGALNGVCMEVEDCAFATLAGIVQT